MDTFGDDHYVGIKEITMDMKVKLKQKGGKMYILNYYI